MITGHLTDIAGTSFFFEGLIRAPPISTSYPAACYVAREEEYQRTAAPRDSAACAGGIAEQQRIHSKMGEYGKYFLPRLYTSAHYPVQYSGKKKQKIDFVSKEN